MRKSLVFLFLFLFSVSLAAFSQIGVGQWREHLPYREALRVTQAGEKIFCSTNLGLFAYNKEDRSIEKFSKVSGLSDIGINALNYYPEKDMLLVAYANSNLDLIEGNEIYNMPDIKNKPMSGFKTINEVLFLGDYAYLSCAFGIVKVNLERREIADTYYIGEQGSSINVNDLVFDGTYFYAATETGIYQADIASSNLADYNNWHKIQGIPDNTGEYISIAYFNNRIFACHKENFEENAIYHFSPENPAGYQSFESWLTNTLRLGTSEQTLLVVAEGGVLGYNENYERTMLIEDYNGSTANPRDALIDSEGTLWVADFGSGLRKQETDAFPFFYPEGPYLNGVVDIDVKANRTWIAQGAVDEAWTNRWNVAAAYGLYDNDWASMVQWSARDIVCVEIDPVNPDRVFAGSWGWGIFQFENQTLTETYDDSNSTLQNIYEGSTEPYVRVGGMAFDRGKKLWITNSGVPNPIVMKTLQGAWYSFPYSNQINAPTLGDIIVRQNGHKWVVLPRGYGLFAFDEKGTYDDHDDDETRKFGVYDRDGKLISNDIFAIAEDRDGAIWIGTREGVAVYYNPGNVFSGENFYAQRIVTELNGEPQYLLKNEKVTAIAVDGANRKWIGTENAGVFLMSADGTEQVLNFNENNSALLSNHVKSIGINQESGEVFLGTSQGLVSYRSDATRGEEEFSEVYAYPNPVRPEYSGDIVIAGLVTDSNVKITDIAGNIVYETTAKGGQALWNGKNFAGERVKTGVYLIFCTNDDGSKTFVSKLLFIN